MLFSIKKKHVPIKVSSILSHRRFALDDKGFSRSRNLILAIGQRRHVVFIEAIPDCIAPRSLEKSINQNPGMMQRGIHYLMFTLYCIISV